MTNKTTVTATFSDGQTVSRKTKMNLTHGYRAQTTIDGQLRTFAGFAGSELLAQKAASAVFGFRSATIEVVPVTVS